MGAGDKNKEFIGDNYAHLLGQKYEWALPAGHTTAKDANERLEAMFGDLELEAFKEVIKDCFREILEIMRTEIRLFLIQQDPLFLKIRNEIEEKNGKRICK